MSRLRNLTIRDVIEAEHIGRPIARARQRSMRNNSVKAVRRQALSQKQGHNFQSAEVAYSPSRPYSAIAEVCRAMENARLEAGRTMASSAAALVFGE